MVSFVYTTPTTLAVNATSIPLTGVSGNLGTFYFGIWLNGHYYTNNTSFTTPLPSTFTLTISDYVNVDSPFNTLSSELPNHLNTYTSLFYSIDKVNWNFIGASPPWSLNYPTDPIPPGNTATFAILAGGGAPCFTKGTMILTPKGEKAVETFKDGDKAITKDGRSVIVKVFKCRFANTNEETAPFHIAKGALGKNCPPRNISLSARHAIQDARGIWQIPKFLATHNSGVQQYGVGEPVEYYHIECPNFFTDNLVANGATVESFKNRQGSSGVVYSFDKSIKGWIRNTEESIHPVPYNPTTAMIYA